MWGGVAVSVMECVVWGGCECHLTCSTPLEGRQMMRTQKRRCRGPSCKSKPATVACSEVCEEAESCGDSPASPMDNFTSLHVVQYSIMTSCRGNT